jgi:hypothetical protein
MTDHPARLAPTADLHCELCGHLPHPAKSRLTFANVAAILPIELAVHAVVLRSDLPYLGKVVLLTVLATVLVVWVTEPSIMRLLQAWLHAPQLLHRRRLESADKLWRLRTRISDEPGALQALAERLEALNANILDLQVHPVAGGALDELTVATSDEVNAEDLVDAATAAGGVDTLVWPTTALALADGQTKALNLSIRVAADPSELAWAVAELLGAEIVTTSITTPGPGPLPLEEATMLKIPSPWQGAFVFSRPGVPFTPAESARAHRLAELAEQAHLSTMRLRSTSSPAVNITQN